MAGLKQEQLGWVTLKPDDFSNLQNLVFTLYTIIHQLAFCQKHFDISCAPKPVTSAMHFNWGHSLNYQRFPKEINPECWDLPHHITQQSGGSVVVESCFYVYNSKEK